jgi:hypothetical protein
MLATAPNDPIFLDAKEPTLLRSFSDVVKDGKKQKRITHAVNVGNQDKLHYTYDLSNGAIAQIWKGDFLDTSPMWDNRGDGSSRPRGAVLALTDTQIFVLNDSKGTFSEAPIESSNYRALGYDLNTDNLPTFRYKIYGSDVEDQISTIENILKLKYSFTNRMGLTFRARHYTSVVSNKQFFNLNPDGTLKANNSIADNYDRNVNYFNIDMVYTWQFAPGSFLNLVWKDSAITNSSISDSSYGENLHNTLQSNHNNSVSLKVIYFLDYLSLKRNNKVG